MVTWKSDYMQDITLDSLSRRLDRGTVVKVQVENQIQLFFTVDKTSIILNGFDKIGKYRAYFVD